MKKILIVDESRLVRDYLSSKLEESGFEVVQGMNGLDGSIKLRGELPDLLVMDYMLSRKSSMELLKEKQENRNTAEVPVILLAAKIDKSHLVKLAQFNVKKIFSKPIKMDSFIHTVGKLLNVEVEIDETPCIIEAHFNDEILFVEVAQGLNREKIELLKYKITELLNIYEVNIPKILIMMSNLQLSEKDSDKLAFLFETIIEQSGTKNRYVKVLTTSDFVKVFLKTHKEFAGIEAASNLGDAMDDLLGLKPDDFAHDEVVHDRLLKTTAPKKEAEESFQMRFDSQRVESGEDEYEKLKGDMTVAVVDDDIVIQELIKTVFGETGWNIIVYENGKRFVEDLPNHSFSLIFLDLMMPEMNGFQVLQYVNDKGYDLPIIVFSALSRKETVVKAVSYGINSYLIKPLKPESLMKKAVEVLSTNF
ncbi:MAG: response regulator [Spirochaetia bacterium]